MTKTKDLFGAAEAAPFQNVPPTEFFSSLLETCAAPLALGCLVPPFPPLPPFDFAQGRLWANEFRRSAAAPSSRTSTIPTGRLARKLI
jgi:hypothetical protein